MNQANTCPKCGSDKQITIAGKVFCANCGTRLDISSATAINTLPAQSSITHNIDSVIQPQPISESVTSQTVQTLSSAPSQLPPAPMSAQIQQLPTDLTTNPIAQPQPPIQSYQVASQQPVSIAPMPPPMPLQNTAPMPAAVASSQQQLQQIYAQSHEPTPPPAPVPQPATQPQLQPQPTQPPIEPSNQVPTENIGSELGQLESANNPVISDSQFNAMAKSVNQPVTAADAAKQSVVFQDIIPPSQQAQIPTILEPTIPIESTIQPIQPVIPQTDIQPAIQQLPVQPNVEPVPEIVSTSSTQQATIDPQKSSNKQNIAYKVASAVATVAAIAIVSAFVWQINYPSLAVKVAGAKAGLSVSLPNYTPAGWQLSGNIAASPGLVNYRFRSPDGTQGFSVTQARSDWDSQALAENYLTEKAPQYLALQSQGLTIYVYNNSATWINHGSWYKLEGKGNDLNQDQIIKIATSL